MNIICHKSKLKGKIEMPASKSVAHRILIAAALANEPTIVCGKFENNDTLATMQMLEKLGAKFQKLEENKTKIFPIVNVQNNKMELDANESGSTLRFMLPVASMLGANCKFVGSKRLGERSIDTMLLALTKNGIKTIGKSLPVELCGKLQSGKFEIDSSLSSQFATGLLFALPLLDGDSEIVIESEMVSKNYIELTLDILKKFSIDIQKTNIGFFVKGNQTYVSPKQIAVEGDWSSASFFAVAGAINGDIELLNMNMNSLQSDKVVIDFLEKMGACVTKQQNFVHISKSKLCAIDIDAKNCPDLIPVLSLALAHANGKSSVANVERLRAKECDRLQAILDIMKKAGINCWYGDGLLNIEGGNPQGFQAKAQNDHRIAMTLAIMSTITNQDITILGADCVDKSYPNFYEDYKSLGGDYEIKI